MTMKQSGLQPDEDCAWAGSKHEPLRKCAGIAHAVRCTFVQVSAAGALLFMIASQAQADCICECVNGQMQPLCSSSIDLPPICPPTICPLDTPSIAPLPSLRLPPLGATSCRPARVCDPFGNCRWQEVCR